jgi:glycosyltransferase involved in cell wall biosynthesis
MTGAPVRTLIAVPAYNEEKTIGQVVRNLRADMPGFDLLVIDDGSRDGTARELAAIGVHTGTHLCNLGYGRAIQTAIKYADCHGYDALITFDADGQHRASDLQALYEAYLNGGYDLLIGSRFDAGRGYRGQPMVRQLGMRLFSVLIALFTGRRIYDTSSGLKVIGRRAFEPLSSRPFVDLHAEAIVYLMSCGYRVGEYAIRVDERVHGQSMHTPINAIKYPLKVMFLILIGAVDARMFRRRERV